MLVYKPLVYIPQLFQKLPTGQHLPGIFVLTQAFGKRLSQFTADLCQTLDHMIAGNEAPQRPEDSET